MTDYFALAVENARRQFTPPPANRSARPCCGEYAVVTHCDGTTDRLYCGVCERTWTQPCADADLITPRPA